MEFFTTALGLTRTPRKIMQFSTFPSMRHPSAIMQFLTRAEAENAVILSADTIVYSDDRQKIFGKPGSERGASDMLRELSGRPHRVITGVMLYDNATGRTSCFAESTDVYFRPLSDREIETYIRVHNPLDKAGAYGIQDGACVFVEKIVGDYYNVVGLPVCRVYTELEKLRGIH